MRIMKVSAAVLAAVFTLSAFPAVAPAESVSEETEFLTGVEGAKDGTKESELSSVSEETFPCY